jgi:hypothetical protein
MTYLYFLHVIYGIVFVIRVEGSVAIWVMLKNANNLAFLPMDVAQ